MSKNFATLCFKLNTQSIYLENPSRMTTLYHNGNPYDKNSCTITSLNMNGIKNNVLIIFDFKLNKITLYSYYQSWENDFEIINKKILY